MFLSSNYFWGEQIPLSDKFLYFSNFLLARFYMGESFLITHLDGGGHLKGRKFGQTSVISQTVVVLLNNFFSQPSIVRDIVFWGESWFRNCSVISSSRWRQRFAKYWIYLGSLLAQNFLQNKSDLHLQPHQCLFH